MTTRFLTDAELDYMADRLGRLPDIEQDLAIALTGQSARPDGSGPRSQPRSRPPYPIHLQVLADELKATLVAVVRDVEEQRGLRYDSGDTITACGQWLHKHRHVLKAMESGGDRFDELVEIIDRCVKVLGRNQVSPLAPAEREAARQAIVSASTVEAIAKRVGVQGLNAARLRLLARRGVVKPVATGPDGSILFRLGEVLDGHRATPARRRA